MPNIRYTPADPYSSYQRPSSPTPAYPYPPNLPQVYTPAKPSIPSRIITFVTYRLPLEIYLNLLLRLPSFYFTRVSHIFVECELMLPDIQQMAVASSARWKELGKEQAVPKPTWEFPQSFGAEVRAQHPALLHFKETWEHFIEAVLREWSTLNIVSALVLPAILTVLQIGPAATDPVARTAALISLICALMSLLYGCLYIIRFGTMRRPHKAAQWAIEAQKLKASIFWSPWVMLSMPAIWLSWSLISFLVCIMAYIWRANSTSDPDDRITSTSAALGTRIALSCILGLGMIYLGAMVQTLSSY
ncbi:hypothetical protein C8J56DRAFT_852370, partial [Mycena floridula]